jgi:multimeric flavodoxin WrbA
MDAADQMEQVYEGLIHWADVVLIATSIRWGAASSLYFKMAERLNCVQNQITIRDNVLIRDKVAAFIVTGGQDNVQGTVGQMLTFFGELGFQFPQFPFVAHSRGWSAEDMENNYPHVHESKELAAGTRALVDRAVQTSSTLLGHTQPHERIPRGGRKAHKLDVL